MFFQHSSNCSVQRRTSGMPTPCPDWLNVCHHANNIPHDMCSMIQSRQEEDVISKGKSYVRYCKILDCLKLGYPHSFQWFIISFLVSKWLIQWGYSSYHDLPILGPVAFSIANPGNIATICYVHLYRVTKSYWQWVSSGDSTVINSLPWFRN